jgi:hypothetical protein
MVRAVVFGPGRIGCGLVGLALRTAGHEVTFVGRDPNLVTHLRRVGGYRVLLTGDDTEVHVVDGVACMVSRRLGDVRSDQPLTFEGDPPAGVDLDGSALAGVAPRVSALTAAAALVAANPARDPSQTRKLLRRVCRLSPRCGLGHQVWQRWASLAYGGGRQTVLLSLTGSTWAARPASLLPLEVRPA